MQELHDKVCEFISRYKQHIEPAQRSSEIMCVEKCNNELLKKDNEITTLKLSLNELQTKYDTMIEEVNKTRVEVMQELFVLKQCFNSLTKQVCSAVDIDNYKKIDILLYDIRELFNKLDNIPEF